MVSFHFKIGPIEFTCGKNFQGPASGGTVQAPLAHDNNATPAGITSLPAAEKKLEQGPATMFRRSLLLKSNYVLNRTATWGMGGMVLAHALEYLGAKSAGTVKGLAIIGGLFALGGLSQAVNYLRSVRHDNENELPIHRMSMAENLNAFSVSLTCAALAAGVVWLFDGSSYAMGLAAAWFGTMLMTDGLSKKLFSTANPEYQKKVYSEKRYGGLPKPKQANDADLETIKKLIRTYSKQGSDNRETFLLIAAYDHAAVTNFLHGIVTRKGDDMDDNCELAIKALGMRHDAQAKDYLIKLISTDEGGLASWIYQENLKDGVYESNPPVHPVPSA